jgi:hypothetical protein
VVRRQVVPVYAAGFVTASGAHAVAANLGRYALGHHGSLWELGLLLGIYDGAEVVLKPVFGALADRTGAKPVMTDGLVLFAAASAAFVIGGDPHLLAAARLAQGTGAPAFSPAAAATVAALGGRKRSGRLFGGYGGAKGIGYLLGPIAGGALVVAGAVCHAGRHRHRHRGRDLRLGSPRPAGSPHVCGGAGPGPPSYQRRLSPAGAAAGCRHRGAVGRCRLPAGAGRAAPPRADRRRCPGIPARGGRGRASACSRAADR